MRDQECTSTRMVTCQPLPCVLVGYCSKTKLLAAGAIIRSDRQGRPKNVGVAVKIESRAKVSYKGGHILKLSDKVTMTRAFTARKKNRPAILFFS